MKTLVANRGEIACRVLKTLSELGLPSVAVYTDVDADAPHVWLADEAVALGEPSNYLDADRILSACRDTGAVAVHPGYGFLSENQAFAEACGQAGVTFIGPSAAAMRALGDKRQAREVAENAGVPVVPGAKECDSLEQARKAVADVGFPVLLKAAGGGGGKGMRKVMEPDSLAEHYDAARREAQAAFGDSRLLVEKYVYPARHVEVQILADGRDAVAIGERECSLQRRYQKIVEEAPSPGIDAATRERLFASAVKLARAVGYAGAGTVEFLVGPDGKHYFLEVNTRLQVEHPVTELCTGLDLVACQIDIARGGALPPQPRAHGHAIEARLNAEDPYAGFLPQTGDILRLRWPARPGVRIDAGIEEGGRISAHYDSMIAKVIAWGANREQARRRLLAALSEAVVLGLPTNQSFLVQVLQRDFFIDGQTFTTTIEESRFEPPPIPDAVRALAERVLERPARTASNDGESDAYSPWEQLEGFRLGQ